MKKNLYFIEIILGILFVFSLTGCQQQTNLTESKTAKYYVEGARVNKSTLMTIIAPYQNKTDLTFDDKKKARNEIRTCNLESFESSADITRDECYDFLVKHGYSPSEANSLFDQIDEKGNALLFFTVKNSSTKMVYLYLEKQ